MTTSRGRQGASIPPPLDDHAFSVIIGVCDRRRPEMRSEVLAARLAAVGNIPLTALEIVDESVRPTLSPTPVHRTRLSGAGLGGQLVDRIGRGDDALVVLEAHGGGLPGDRLLDDEAEVVLERSRPPVLVLGPDAEAAMPTTLIIAVDGTTPRDAVVRVATTWRHTFAATQLELIELVAPDPWPPDDTSVAGDADPLLGHLTEVRVEHSATTDPVGALLQATARRVDPALLVVAPRWPGSSHWYSTARHLIRRAACPVMVVRADLTSDR
jgi:nucleotide-binding universal stress UspA family protein